MIQSRAWIVFFLVSIAGTNPALAHNDTPETQCTSALQNIATIKGTLMEEPPDDYLVNTVVRDDMIDGIVFETIATIGILGHGFGGSLVHIYHTNYGKALGRVGLRAALPIAVAASCFLQPYDDWDWDTVMLSFGAGLVLAPIIDILFLARKTKSTVQDETLIEYGSLKATPSFGVTRKGDLTFGLAGKF